MWIIRTCTPDSYQCLLCDARVTLKYRKAWGITAAHELLDLERAHALKCVQARLHIFEMPCASCTTLTHLEIQRKSS